MKCTSSTSNWTRLHCEASGCVQTSQVLLCCFVIGNKKLESIMVCFSLGPVPDSKRSEFVLPSPSKLGLGRYKKTAVPESSSAGCCPSLGGLGYAGNLPAKKKKKKRNVKSPYLQREGKVSNTT